MATRKIGDTVRIDTDNEEWGRVCGKAIILECFTDVFLVDAETIRANILVFDEDID